MSTAWISTGEEPRPAAAPPAATDGLWARFAAGGDAPDFFRAWLGLQCAAVPAARAALLLMESADGRAFAPLAVWPDAAVDFTRLRPTAEEALQARRGLVRSAGEAGRDDIPAGESQIAYAIEQEGHVFGLVVLSVGTADPVAVQAVLRTLHWGVGWLEAEIRRRRGVEDRQRLDRAVGAMDLLALAGEHPTIEQAGTAVVNELAARTGSARVGLAVIRGRGASRSLRLVALSHTAWFRRKSDIVRDLENAMEEALDQAATVGWPEVPGVADRITVAHRAFIERGHARGLLSLVLSDHGAPVGVLSLEVAEGKTFDADTVRYGEAVAALLGPLVELKRKQRRWITGRVPEAAGRAFRTVAGMKRPSVTLGVVAALGVLAWLALATGPFQVSARAVLEGEVQRAVAAPFDGFVASARLRAGDPVKKGDPIATLDDKDLRLEVQRWTSEYAQLVQQRRKALAEFDRAEVALVDAQLEQAKAQVDLTTAKLDRTRIEAPIDGVIISGDLSQKLGSPVQQGALLFEIAPLASYRVILKVDEQDIRHVAPGQGGHLLLSGRADEALPFKVTKLTSVAAVEDGRNLFRAEALLEGEPPAIRPGMEGVGKIEVGRAPLLWTWTRRFVDWLRLAVWRWTP